MNNDERVERGQPGHDSRFKVCPIMDLIMPRYSAVSGPREELSCGAMTIAFERRSNLKVDNPQKTVKYGCR